MQQSLTVDVQWDAEVDVWIAMVHELPIATESETLDGLRGKISVMAADLLSKDHSGSITFDVSLRVSFRDTIDVTESEF
jgi:hypothetical protein